MQHHTDGNETLTLHVPVTENWTVAFCLVFFSKQLLWEEGKHSLLLFLTQEHTTANTMKRVEGKHPLVCVHLTNQQVELTAFYPFTVTGVKDAPGWSISTAPIRLQIILYMSEINWMTNTTMVVKSSIYAFAIVRFKYCSIPLTCQIWVSRHTQIKMSAMKGQKNKHGLTIWEIHNRLLI